MSVKMSETVSDLVVAVGSLAIIGCNMMDMFQKKITKRVNNVDIGSYPLDTPPQTTTAMKIYGKIYSGLKVDIGLGMILSALFIYTTQTSGYIWSGIPRITFTTDLTYKAIATGMVSPIENGLSVIIAFTISSWLMHKYDIKEKRMRYILLVVGSGVGGYFMKYMHSNVYGLDVSASQFVLIFFTLGNLITMWRGNQIAFDMFHFAWNYWVIYSGMNIALGLTIYPTTTAMISIMPVLILIGLASLMGVFITRKAISMLGINIYRGDSGVDCSVK